MSNYGACGHCKNLGARERVGTINVQTGRSEVVLVCADCAKLYYRLSRRERRSHDKQLQHLLKHGPPTGPRGKKASQPKPQPKPAPKQSSIVLPEHAGSDLIVPPQQGLIIPGREPKK